MSEEKRHGCTRPSADACQRQITAHMMQWWKLHHYVLEYVFLGRSAGSEYLKLRSVRRILAVPEDPANTIFNEHFSQTAPAESTSQIVNSAAPVQSRPMRKPFLQIHGCAHSNSDARGVCCGSDDVSVQKALPRSIRRSRARVQKSTRTPVRAKTMSRMS